MRTTFIRWVSRNGKALLIKAGLLQEDYELTVPPNKPLPGSLPRVSHPDGRMEWILTSEINSEKLSVIDLRIDGIHAALSLFFQRLREEADRITSIEQNYASRAWASDSNNIQYVDFRDNQNKTLKAFLDTVVTENTFSSLLFGDEIIESLATTVARSSDMQTFLNAKANVNHTHSFSQITGFNLNSPPPIGMAVPGNARFQDLTVVGDFEILDSVAFSGGCYVGEAFRHAGDFLAFYNASPITKPSITGVKGRVTTVELDNLILALTRLGLVSDDRQPVVPPN